MSTYLNIFVSCDICVFNPEEGNDNTFRIFAWKIS